MVCQGVRLWDCECFADQGSGNRIKQVGAGNTNECADQKSYVQEYIL